MSDTLIVILVAVAFVGFALVLRNMAKKRGNVENLTFGGGGGFLPTKKRDHDKGKNAEFKKE